MMADPCLTSFAPVMLSTLASSEAVRGTMRAIWSMPVAEMRSAGTSTTVAMNVVRSRLHRSLTVLVAHCRSCAAASTSLISNRASICVPGVRWQ